MKALTLTQPWASLVALGVKTIETRSWATKYRGPLAIHAAKGLGSVGGTDGLWRLCGSEPFATALRAHHGSCSSSTLPLGAIVAVCQLAEVLPTYAGDNEGVLLFGDILYDEPEEIERLTADGWWYDMGIPVAHWEQRQWGNFEGGRFAWMLKDVRPVPPQYVRGALGLWEWEASEAVGG